MNNNITEDLVSFETAKLLKEKGFDLYCTSLYHDNSGNLSDMIGNYNSTDNEEDRPHSSRPTHSLAIKWLRENYSIHITVHCHVLTQWCYEVTLLEPFQKGSVVTRSKGFGEEDYNSPEEATEAALKYCLTTLLKT